MRLRELFDTYDRGRKGHLSVRELRELVRSLMPDVQEGDMRYFQVGQYCTVLGMYCCVTVFVLLMYGRSCPTCTGRCAFSAHRGDGVPVHSQLLCQLMFVCRQLPCQFTVGKKYPRG